MNAPRVRVGINLVMARPDAAVHLAQCAEACGYDSVWSGEHVALNLDTDFSRYGSKRPYGPRSNFLEPMSVLAAVGQATTTVRLGTGILIAPLRNPVMLARTVTTVDVLSGGRLDLGVGVGWNEPEFVNVGASYSDRGRRTDEMLQVFDVLFGQESPEFHGTFYDFGPIGFEPKPIQRPRPKTLIGGYSPAALRRAAKYGDGWYGAGRADNVGSIVTQLRKELHAAGRGDVAFEILVTAIEGAPTRDELERLADQGVHRVVMIPWGGDSPRMGTVGKDGTAELERYAESVGLVG
jgi:probable F420-dependent oxidoreductase